MLFHKALKAFSSIHGGQNVPDLCRAILRDLNGNDDRLPKFIHHIRQHDQTVLLCIRFQNGYGVLHSHWQLTNHFKPKVMPLYFLDLIFTYVSPLRQCLSVSRGISNLRHNTLRHQQVSVNHAIFLQNRRGRAQFNKLTGCHLSGHAFLDLLRDALHGSLCLHAAFQPRQRPCRHSHALQPDIKRRIRCHLPADIPADLAATLALRKSRHKRDGGIDRRICRLLGEQPCAALQQLGNGGIERRPCRQPLGCIRCSRSRHALAERVRALFQAALCPFADRHIARARLAQLARARAKQRGGGVVLLCLRKKRLYRLILLLQCGQSQLLSRACEYACAVPANAVQKPRRKGRAFQLALQSRLHAHHIAIGVHIGAFLDGASHGAHALFRRPLHRPFVHLRILQNVVVFLQKLLPAQKAVVRLIEPRFLISRRAFRQVVLPQAPGGVDGRILHLIAPLEVDLHGRSRRGRLLLPKRNAPEGGVDRPRSRQSSPLCAISLRRFDRRQGFAVGKRRERAVFCAALPLRRPRRGNGGLLRRLTPCSLRRIDRPFPRRAFRPYLLFRLIVFVQQALVCKHMRSPLCVIFQEFFVIRLRYRAFCDQAPCRLRESIRIAVQLVIHHQRGVSVLRQTGRPLPCFISSSPAATAAISTAAAI